MPTDPEIFDLTTTNRLLVADVLDDLDVEQWPARTLCDGWDVHALAAHLLQPMLVGFGRFFVTALRHRGDTERTVDAVTRRLADRSRADIVALLRRHAADRVSPRRVGPMGPFAETCIHLRDLARPLGLDADVPREHWVALLDHLVSPGVAPALVRPGRLRGISLVATDADWRAGHGAEVAGPVESLAMAVTGRPAALPDLAGEGVAVLARGPGGT